MKHVARVEAALYVASNWRIQQRLPRITALANALGFLTCRRCGAANCKLAQVDPKGPFLCGSCLNEQEAV